MIVHNLSVNKYERNKEIKYHNLKMMMMIELIITSVNNVNLIFIRRFRSLWGIYWFYSGRM